MKQQAGMTNRSLGFLGALTVVGIVAAALVSYYRAPKTSIHEQPLYPDLSGQINSIKELDISGKGRKVSLVRQGDKWVIKEADGYPAEFDKIRQALLNLADLRVLAGKTKNPELYSRLGVEDPDKKEANSLLVTALGDNNKKLVDLIVGKERRTAAAGGKPGIYVRQPGDKQALLVGGSLDISSDLSDWFDRDIIDVNNERIQEILLQHADGSTVHLERTKGTDDFTLDNLPKDKQAMDVMVNRMGTLLENFFVDGVRADSKLQFPEKTEVATITTFDGMTVRIVSADVNDAHYARFSFSYDAPAEPTSPEQKSDTGKEDKNADKPEEQKRDMGKEVQKLNAALNGWSFQVPDFKYKLLATQFDDLIRKAPPPEKQEKGSDSKAAHPASSR